MPLSEVTELVGRQSSLTCGKHGRVNSTRSQSRSGGCPTVDLGEKCFDIFEVIGPT